MCALVHGTKYTKLISDFFYRCNLSFLKLKFLSLQLHLAGVQCKTLRQKCSIRDTLEWPFLQRIGRRC